jgi:hypothetical protein
MNYWDGQRWRTSDPSFELTDDAFVAERVQHKVRLAANLNVAGAVTVTMPDGLVLRSTPVAVALYDAASGRTAIIASISDCAGALISTNQVLYEDAFNQNGVIADVVYTLGRGSFEQDVVLKAPLNPRDYGFSTNHVRIQIYTEFYDAPNPDRVRRPIRVEESLALRNRLASPDLVDEILGFGEFVIATGRALRPGKEALSGEAAAPVANAFVTTGHRTFLVESVEYASVQGDLASLPHQAANAPKEDMRVPAAVPGAYAVLSLPRPAPSKQVAVARAPKRTIGPIACARAGLAIDYVATISGTVSGSKTFQGDTTYFVSGPVYCNGPVTIEGGAVFKYPNSTGNNPTTSFIKLNSGVTCKTSNYRPAIFTAGDDPSIGDPLSTDVWPNYTGDTTGKYYANPALWAYYLGSSALTNLRFSFAQEAVRVEGSAGYSATVSHSQFVNCVRGIVLTGSGSGSGGSGLCATLNNNLLANVQFPLTMNANLSFGSAYHCTIDNSTRLMTANASASFGFVNSIFANVAATTAAPGTLSGSYNGFYPSTTPQFGNANSRFTTDLVPFEPGSFEDGGTTYFYITTWQGRHYLAESTGGDAFRSVGTTNLPTALKKDLLQTTTSRPELLNTDLTDNMALGPQAPRESGVPSLGYHYPVLDYVVAAATVNNVRLTLKEGLALGFTFPYAGIDFGLRVNAGARLVSEGSPTNLVVLARANLVQEFPESYWQGRQMPLLAARAIGDPLPEIHLRFTDLPSCAGDYRVYALQMATWPQVQGEEIATLEVRDCQIRGGVFCYESGYHRARKLTLRNSLFERAKVWLADYHYDASAVSEDLVAHNNLFYGGVLDLKPYVGNTWTFIDNVFHTVQLIEEAAPDVRVANHHHNAYVAMPGGLCSPNNPNPGDQTMSGLNFDTNSVGRFYLRADATQLLDQGSRSAAAAGLYHYTSRTNQVKEGGKTAPNVNIGLHYVALVNGQPADSDAAGTTTDGFPDFVEDANGNGVADANESNWQVRETTPVRILGSLGGTVVSGVLRVPVQCDNSSGNVLNVRLTDDEGNGLPATTLAKPFSGSLTMEVDTIRLANGPLTFKAQTVLAVGSSGTQYGTVDSEPVTLNVNNDLSYYDWTEKAGEQVASVAFNRSGPFAYLLLIYGADCPYAPFPQPVDYFEGQSDTSGAVAQLWTPVGDPATHPVFYPYVYSTVSGGQYLPPATVFPPLIAAEPFPDVGAWFVAYEEPRVFDAVTGTEYSITDPLQSDQIHTWFHDGALPGWLGLAAWWPCSCPVGQAPVYYYPPNPARRGQAWPIRFEADYRFRLPTDRTRADWAFFNDVVISPLVRNLYIRSHMDYEHLGLLSKDNLQRIHHRYHFVFLDGCDSVHGGTRAFLPKAFGFEPVECFDSVPYSWYESTTSNPKRLRPAGGVAMRDHVEWYNTSLGAPYVGELPAELSAWYMKFQQEWTLPCRPLRQALNLAHIYARGFSTSLQMAPWQPTGNETARVIGYVNLRHNEYNHYAARNSAPAP